MMSPSSNLKIYWCGKLVTKGDNMSNIDEMRASKDIDGLIHVLKNEEGDARMYASIALSEMGAEAVEPLLGALKEGNEDVKWEASIALSRIGEPAVEGLKEFLDDEDEEVKYYASVALGQMWLQGHDFKGESV